MTAVVAATLLADLIASGHFIPSGEPGVFGRGATCVLLQSRVDAVISGVVAEDCAEVLRFSPVVPRRLLDATGYTRNFPHLCGTIMSLDAPNGTLVAHPVEDSRLGMLPAGCYPAYPAIAARGPLSKNGATLDLGDAFVFRNEPSDDPYRLQIFHQRELVRMGQSHQVLAWRELWLRRAAAIFESLELDVSIVVASDPFFGRGGKLHARNQIDDKLKYEAVLSVSGGGTVALSSFNYHRDQLAHTFGLVCEDGSVAHTACVGFGLERISIALFDRHGCDVRDWPLSVLDALDLNA